MKTDIKFMDEFLKYEVLKSGLNYVIFGASNFGVELLRVLKDKLNMDKEILFFVDNDKNKQGKFIQGIEVKSVEELIQFSQEKFRVIIASQYSTDIIKQLDELNILNYCTVEYSLLTYLKNESEIQKVLNLVEDDKSRMVIENIMKYRISKDAKYVKEIYEDRQYFPKDIISLDENEVFIDGGSYIGDTIEEFIKETSGKFNKIYGFEPSKENFNKLHQAVSSLNDNRIETFNEGLYKENTTVLFSDGNGAGSSIGENGIISIDVINLDSKLKDIKPTFIKMDIEGAEMEALEGAKWIICNHKPTLAICIYHKLDDLWKIPLYIKSLNKDYKILIRHHGINEWETVCYCV